jgi:hypothetical protein
MRNGRSCSPTEPYRRLKVREKKIAEQFNDPSRVFTDEDFKKFVLSDELLKRAPELRSTLERWKKADLQQAAEHTLQYLPASAVIRAKVFPTIKPNHNSFVWDTSTDPTIFLYLGPDVSAAKFTNTVAHELHHIGLASALADYHERIEALPEPANTAAGWMPGGLQSLQPFGSRPWHSHKRVSTKWKSRKVRICESANMAKCMRKALDEGSHTYQVYANAKWVSI